MGKQNVGALTLVNGDEIIIEDLDECPVCGSNQIYNCTRKIVPNPDYECESCNSHFVIEMEYKQHYIVRNGLEN